MPPKRKQPSQEDDSSSDSPSPPPEANTKRKRSAPKQATLTLRREQSAFAAMIARERDAPLEMPLEMPPKDIRNLKLRGTTSAATYIWRNYRDGLKAFDKMERKAARKKAKMAQREADAARAAKAREKALRARAREQKITAREAERERAREARKAAMEGVRAAREAEKAVRAEIRAERQREREARKAAGKTGRKARNAPAERAAWQPSRAEVEEEYEADDELVDDEEETKWVQPVIRRHFLEVPLEIREMVYENLLTTDTPIRLIEGWAKLWKGRGPGLDTAIMGVNHQIRDECIKVLYGRNTFEYVLRDTAPGPPLYDDNSASDGDDAPNDSIDELDFAAEDDLDNDGDSEYTLDEDEMDEDEDYAAPQPSRPRSAPGAPARNASHPDKAIDIATFGPFFRHITIVTEKNRTERGYLHSMADALDAFAGLAGPEEPCAKIHTVTIVVNPSRRDGSGKITFLNFFRHSSRVVASLRGVPCQFIRFVVNTDRSARGERLPGAFRLDVRPQEACENEDEFRRQQRLKHVAKTQRMFQRLPELIEQAWKAGADPEPRQDESDFH